MERQEGQVELPKGARIQQVDPDTGEFYPWWVPTLDGEIEFDPSKYNPSLYKSPISLLKDEDLSIENPFDLDNLRFIDPAEVKRTFDDLVRKAQKYPSKLLTVMVGTGGTLSMKQDKKTHELKPQLSPDQLMREAGAAGSQFIASSLSMPTLIDSSQMEIDYVADVAIAMTWIYSQLMGHGLIENDVLPDNKMDEYTSFRNTEKRFTGFIVCHGTDTLVQSQTHLSFMLGSYCPFNVFYVAAQKTTEDAFNDVGANFKLALEASKFFQSATDDLEDRIGVHGICVGGTAGGIYNGPTSLKISDRHVDLLQDHNHGGRIVSAGDFAQSVNLDFYEKLAEESRDGFSLPIILRGHNNVLGIKPTMGNDPNEIEKMVRNSKAKAVVIETFGSFTVNRKIVDAITKAARETGKIVFAVNPFPSGGVDHTYVDAKYLAQQGIVPLKMLPHAAYTKLLLATVIFGDDIHKIIRFMVSNNFRGEQLHRKQDPTTHRKHFKPEQKSRKDAVYGDNFSDDVMRFIHNLDPYEYLDIDCIERLHVMNDKILRDIVEQNRRVLRKCLVDILEHLQQEEGFQKWVHKSGIQVTPQTREICTERTIEYYFKHHPEVDVELFMYKHGENDIHMICSEIWIMASFLLNTIGFPKCRKLRAGGIDNEATLMHDEPYKQLIQNTARAIQQVSYKDDDITLAIPHIGQPILSRDEVLGIKKRIAERREEAIKDRSNVIFISRRRDREKLDS